MQEWAKQNQITPLTNQAPVQARTKTMEEWAKEKGIQSQSQISIPQGKTGLGGVATGIGKGLASTFTGTAALGEKVLGGIGRALTPKKYEAMLGFEKQAVPLAEQVIPEKYRKPQGTAEKVGFYGEQIGEFLLPGGEISKGAKALEESLKGLSLAPKLAKFGGAVGAEALGGAGVSALQSGGDIKETAMGGLAGAAAPPLSLLAKGVFKGAGKTIAETLGKTTGAGEAAIKSVTPEAMQVARQAGREGVETFQRKALDVAREGLNLLKEARRAEYLPRLNEIKLNTKEFDSAVQSLRQKAVNALQERGVTFGEGKNLNNLDFGKSTILKNQNVVERAFNDLMSWTDTTPGGLDTLKKRLSEFADEIPVTERGGAKPFVLSLRDGVDSLLKNEVKGYEKMTSAYREASDMIKEIEKTLSLGTKSSDETAIKKLMSTLRQNNETRLSLLDELDKVTGTNIRDLVVGSTLAPLRGRGLQGVVGGAVTPAGITASVLNPSFLPYMVTYAIASSPRLVGEIINLFNKFSAGTLGKPGIDRFVKLLLQAIREGVTSGRQSTPKQSQSTQQ